MKFDYMVKYNGVYYNAGEDVPMGASVPPTEPVVKADEIEKEEPKKKPSKTTKKLTDK